MAARRVLVALSGGLDSAVTAFLLQRQGFDVSGLTLRLQPGDSPAVDCGIRVAANLGIAHSVLDVTKNFHELVIEPFRLDYLSGRTPNPCIRCNRLIKFGILLDYAIEQDFEYLATGHYARILHYENKYHLLRGLDSTKDQSYFLYSLDQAQLAKVLFPLGKHSKAEVRRIAEASGLLSHVNCDESQDICFAPPKGYGALIYAAEPPVEGEIVDSSGRVLGRHKGLAYYTIGQRHGLEIANTEPLYVVKVDAGQNLVEVGRREELLRREINAGEAAWICGEPPTEWNGITARIRYRSPAFEVKIIILHNGGLIITFAEPQWALAAGQSIVFYKGEEVLGGGIIK